MLTALWRTLVLSDPFDACVWAATSCAFFGLMRFGKVAVRTRAAFSPVLHLCRQHVTFGKDDHGKPYAKLFLPSAKTAAAGKVQTVYLVEQGDNCPLAALRNLAAVVPAGADDPLFSWRDRHGATRPLLRDAAVERINAILMAWGWGTIFGHLFRIGGASFFLSRGVSPEIVRLAGRWKSLAYETYIRAFEQVASLHLAHAESSSHSRSLPAPAASSAVGLAPGLSPQSALQLHHG
ncbi:hypothetical protein EWM64_g8419 [Hericium alpestre]|uniref:Tyr recombinase domain-containing protein n=1 Tax=Hericium alpestre TaxID=135208 RepID=A0A4Y9ZNM7_9AGAM|nr:hypothetical protein EWM64_g8419 [Hericium alpestre]